MRTGQHRVREGAAGDGGCVLLADEGGVLVEEGGERGADAGAAGPIGDVGGKLVEGLGDVVAFEHRRNVVKRG